MVPSTLESLPVELIATIFSLLDIYSLKQICNVSSRLRAVASDPVLNPWRAAIMRSLASPSPEELSNISVLSTVPRHNWLEILCYASPLFLLFQATLPNITESQYEESFRRRFLPSWGKIRRDGKWKEAFIKMLFTVYHRSNTSCTTLEAWTNYMTLNRTGSANSCHTFSRTFNPVAVFHDMKVNANLAHLPTRVRLLVRLADVRVIVFGVLHRPKSLFVNRNAQLLLNPPGVRGPHEEAIHSPEIPSSSDDDSQPDHSPTEDRRSAEVNDPGPSTQSVNPPRSPLLELANRTRSASVSHPQRSSTLAALFRTRSKDGVPKNSQEAEATITSSEGQRARRMSLMRFLGRGAGASDHARGTSVGAGVSASSMSSPSSEPSLGAMTEPLPPIADSPPASQPSSPMIRPENRRYQRTNHTQDGHHEHNPLRYPTPHPTHASYPNHTPGGRDWRWQKGGDVVRFSLIGEQETVFIHPSDDDRVWVGPMLIAAQLYPNSVPAQNVSDATDPQLFENDILYTQSSRWASFGWADLWAIAPWLEERITKRIEGEGLGID